MVAHDLAADAKAQAGALAFGLGGEHGAEDLAQQLGGDALAGVVEVQLPPEAARRALLGGLRRERHLAALGHGVHGVVHEVDEELLHLLAVHVQTAVRRGLGGHGDAVGRQGGRPELLQVLEEAIEAEGLPVQLGTAGEVEEAAHDVAHALDLAADDPQALAGPFGQVLLGLQQLEVARHQVEGRAHLVGEGGGQLASHGQPLLGPELFPQQRVALDQGRQLVVLGLQFGEGGVDAVLQVGVEAADLADEGFALLASPLELHRHVIEPRGDEAQLVAAAHRGPGAGLASFQSLHGQHLGLDGIADEHAQDEPEQDELTEQHAREGAQGAVEVVVPDHLPPLQVAVGADEP